MSAAPRPGPGGAPRRWARDLLMGARFAVEGRESWMRTLLTAVGVGLGVTLLLFTAACPTALHQRDAREQARSDLTSRAEAKADDTLLVATVDTTFRDRSVRGRLVQPEGPRAPLPPGVPSYPGPGEMVVSPALGKLLASDEGALLRERLPYRVTGTIGNEGLIGPNELSYVAGTRELDLADGSPGIRRIDAFGTESHHEPLDPVLLLLVLIAIVALLMPVGVFVAAAVRFGGERRDRRLAALRLVGADGRMVRRVAAGETLAGALLGLVVGTVLFLGARRLAGHVTLFDVSFFPSDLVPAPGLTVLIACAVPVASVLVTLFALRRVVIEPLGVVRTARPVRRRLWWRLLLPLVGLGLLTPMIGQGKTGGTFDEWLVVPGTVLLLVGATVLLPWVVETVVHRLRGGPVSWQLAVRRLQLSSGTAARMVNGISVAVAGAIALQMVFSAVADDYTETTRQDPDRAQMAVHLPARAPVEETGRNLLATPGVRDTTVVGMVVLSDRAQQAEHFVTLSVGDCTALRELAHLPRCREGDAFVATNPMYDREVEKVVRPGGTVYVAPGSAVSGRSWRLPETLRTARVRTDPGGMDRNGLLVTPSALPRHMAAAVSYDIFLRVDTSDPDVRERVRTVAAKAAPLARVEVFSNVELSRTYETVRTGLFVGASCVLALIGASMLVGQLEQVRERRRLLSALVAFGTRRRTLSMSVLWQTAIPIGLGVLLATAVGLALGTVLLLMVRAPLAVAWSDVGAMAGLGTALVLVVTGLSMPVLARTMRPDGLRTE